jgi:alpha-amylase
VAATTYAKAKGVTLFNYGEVLDSVGSSRSRSYYNNYLNALTDNSVGYKVLSGVVNQSAATSSTSSYLNGQAASKTVLWAESHDTYMNDSGSSKNTTQDQVESRLGR